MNFGQRFQEAFKNESISEIASRLGKTYQGVKNYIEGRVPPAETLIEISNSTGCSIHWLLTGEGPKYIADASTTLFDEDNQRIIEQIALAEKKTPRQIVKELIAEAIEFRKLHSTLAPDVLLFRTDIGLVPLPLVGSISAGQPIEYYKEQKQVLVAETFLQKGYQSFVLRVVGNDWAAEGFVDGDLLICSETTQPENGQVVIALLDGFSTIKRWFAHDGVVRLQPANGKGDQSPLPRDRVKVVCVVVGVQRTP